MPRIAAALLALTLAGSVLAAEVSHGVTGKNIATVTFQSESLGQDRNFNILLPLDYETSTSRYPVLYLLHGYGDDHSAWSLMTNLSAYAAKHRIIVVMPDASRSFYVNSVADPKARFEDYIVKDLIPYLDTHYRTIPLRRGRAVAGLSMGGYGAAFLGLKHYKDFAAIGVFSGALAAAKRPIGAGKIDQEIQPYFGPQGSAERRGRDPFALLENVPAAEMPLIYVTCGGQDFLIKDNRDFIALLADKKVPYEYREVSPRVHSWDFWDEQIDVFVDMLTGKLGFGAN